LLESCCFLAAAKLLLALVPFRVVRRLLGEMMSETPHTASHLEIHSLGEYRWALKTVVARSKWLRVCLVQAMAAKWMLSRRGVPSTLYLGVRRDATDVLQAHAWLRTGETILIGAKGKPNFQVIASFGTSPLHD